MHVIARERSDRGNPSLIERILRFAQNDQVSYLNGIVRLDGIFGYSSSSLSTAINASCGTSTLPSCRMRFLPSFCFSSSFFFRVISPP